MRHLRAKQGRKTLAYYRISFGIAPPYSVLLDGNFIHAATRHHIDLHARIRKQLNGEAYVLLVPSCVVEELEQLGAPVAAALAFARNHCDLLDAPKRDDAETCTEVIKSLVGAANARKFFVATQEEELRSHLRGMPGVPLMHIQRTVLLLESPSSSSRQQSGRAEAQKQIGVSGAEVETFALARRVRQAERAKKRREDGERGAALAMRGGRRGKPAAKGPNPLSVKKKKKKDKNKGEQKGKTGSSSSSSGGGEKKAKVAGSGGSER